MPQVRGTKEQLAARIGVLPLGPGEAGGPVWIRAPREVFERFEALKPHERGEVVKAGLEALGLLGVEDGQKTR